MQNNMVQYKLENHELKNLNGTCYYFDDAIKLEDFDLNNMLIDEKSH